MFTMKVADMSWQWQTFSVFVIGCMSLCYCADPILSQNSLSDSVGNTADSDSIIKWVDLPSGSPYVSSDRSYDNKGMGALYGMARTFAKLCLFPSGYPKDLISQLSSGLDLSAVTNNISEYVTPILGYGICIAVGILFMLIFTLVGCCFGCCRCCGNCGGKRIQDEDDASNNCKRNAYSITLFILIAVTVSGSICNYVSNESMAESLTNFGTTATNNLEDIKTYMDNIKLQMERVAKTNFNFTTDVVFRDLESMGFLVGIPVRDTMKQEGDVDATFGSIISLQGNIDDMSNALLQVDSSLGNLKDSVAVLTNNLQTLNTDIDTYFTNCVGNCDPNDKPDTSLDFDVSGLPDISSQVADIEAVKDEDLSSLSDDAKKDFDDIPQRVQNETGSVVDAVKKQITGFSSEIDPMMDEIDSMTSGDISSQMDSFSDTITGYTDSATSYKKYSWYGGVGLASIILLICLLQFLGLLFGVFGHERTAKPTERSFISNCGGNCLMASVAFIFIFSWLLTLLTMIIFAIGVPIEVLLCDPISDPEFVVFDSVFNTILDEQMGGGESFLGKTLFNNGSIDLKLTDVLRNCKANQAAYKALKLENVIDFDSIANVRNHVDIDSNLDLSSIDMSSTTIVTPELSDQLSNLKTSSDIDYATFRTKLANDTTTVDLSSEAAALRALNYGGTAQAQMDIFADNLDKINNEDVVYVNGNKTKLSNDIDALEVVTNGIPAAVDAVNASLHDLQDYLQNNGSIVIEKEVKIFAARLFGIFDSFINDIKDALDNEIGACEPIWNLYHSMFVVALCRYTVDPLSGFWFSLGWCVFFFVPSAIFSVKLAKHFRTMEESSYLDTVYGQEVKNHPAAGPIQEPDDFPPPYQTISPSPIFKSNKVGHADDF